MCLSCIGRIIRFFGRLRVVFKANNRNAACCENGCAAQPGRPWETPGFGIIIERGVSMFHLPAGLPKLCAETAAGAGGESCFAFLLKSTKTIRPFAPSFSFWPKSRTYLNFVEGHTLPKGRHCLHLGRQSYETRSPKAPTPPGFGRVCSRGWDFGSLCHAVTSHVRPLESSGSFR